MLKLRAPRVKTLDVQLLQSRNPSLAEMGRVLVPPHE